MEDFIQVLIFLVIAVVSILGRVLSRRPQQRQPQPDEEEITLPPWGNLPTPVERERSPRSVEVKTSPAPPRPRPETVRKPATFAPAVSPPPMMKPETEAPSQRKKLTIAGAAITPQTFRQGIILTEILGRPKFLRHPRRQ